MEDTMKDLKTLLTNAARTMDLSHQTARTEMVEGFGQNIGWTAEHRLTKAIAIEAKWKHYHDAMAFLERCENLCEDEADFADTFDAGIENEVRRLEEQVQDYALRGVSRSTCQMTNAIEAIRIQATVEFTREIRRLLAESRKRS
jgi:pterin-4a-carbinolamine dehydratase